MPGKLLMHYAKLILLLCFSLYGGSSWADSATDKVVETYQAEITKAGAAYDALVSASTTKAQKALAALEAKAKDDQAKADIQAVAAQLDAGTLAPAFVDPRRYDVQPLPWKPLTDIGLDGNVQINARSGIVELGANEPDGQAIGYFKAGTIVSIRFIGGMFRIGGKGSSPVKAVLDPDSEGAAVIVTGDKNSTVAKLPGQTAVTPFLFKVPKDGEYRLCPRTRSWGNNLGLGAFEIKLGG